MKSSERQARLIQELINFINQIEENRLELKDDPWQLLSAPQYFNEVFINEFSEFLRLFGYRWCAAAPSYVDLRLLRNNGKYFFNLTDIANKKVKKISIHKILGRYLHHFSEFVKLPGIYSISKESLGDIQQDLRYLIDTIIKKDKNISSAMSGDKTVSKAQIPEVHSKSSQKSIVDKEVYLKNKNTVIVIKGKTFLFTQKQSFVLQVLVKNYYENKNKFMWEEDILEEANKLADLTNKFTKKKIAASCFKSLFRSRLKKLREITEKNGRDCYKLRLPRKHN